MGEALQDLWTAVLEARSRALIQTSRGRIMSSCERLVGRRPRISGGAEPPLDEVTVRQRVRALLDRGILPGIRPREIRGEEPHTPHDCTICGVRIGVGELGFRLPPPDGAMLVVHRRCFDLWTQEAAERVAEVDQA